MRYYVYATGTRETNFQILYNDSGITSFKDIENARKRAKEDIEFVSKGKPILEAIVIDIKNKEKVLENGTNSE